MRTKNESVWRLEGEEVHNDVRKYRSPGRRAGGPSSGRREESPSEQLTGKEHHMFTHVMHASLDVGSGLVSARDDDEDVIPHSFQPHVLSFRSPGLGNTRRLEERKKKNRTAKRRGRRKT